MIRLHTFPLFSIRPLYLTIRAFHKAINDVILSRRAIHAMNNLFPLATEQDLLQGIRFIIIIFILFVNYLLFEIMIFLILIFSFILRCFEIYPYKVMNCEELRLLYKVLLPHSLIFLNCNNGNLFHLYIFIHLHSGDNTCIICREEMTPVSGAKKLPCNHIFHANCLRSWFQRQQSCPTCRTDILGLHLSHDSFCMQFFNIYLSSTTKFIVTLSFKEVFFA